MCYGVLRDSHPSPVPLRPLGLLPPAPSHPPGIPPRPSLRSLRPPFLRVGRLPSPRQCLGLLLPEVADAVGARAAPPERPCLGGRPPVHGCAVAPRAAREGRDTPLGVSETETTGGEGRGRGVRDVFFVSLTLSGLHLLHKRDWGVCLLFIFFYLLLKLFYYVSISDRHSSAYLVSEGHHVPHRSAGPRADGTTHEARLGTSPRITGDSLETGTSTIWA